jgi:hypothetical protein
VEILFAIFMLGFLFGAAVVMVYKSETTERESALAAELETLRAVNFLGQAAWQARRALRDEVDRQVHRS